MSIHPQRGMGRELPQSQVILPENAVVETLDEAYGETKMKTEEQVRTWWISFGNPFDHVAWELPVNKNSTKVIAHEDHLAIVAELEERIQKLRKALAHYGCTYQQIILCGPELAIEALAEDDK